MSRQATPRKHDGSKVHQVYLMLRSAIVGGEHACGFQLPAENKLAEQFGVSRATIRRAISILVDEGFIEHRAHSGNVVSLTELQHLRIRADISTLMPEIRRMGDETSVRLIEFGYVDASLQIATLLRIDAGARLQRAVRVRSALGHPFSYLITHVPAEIGERYSESDLASVPLFRLLERSGTRIDHVSQSITACLATPYEAQALSTNAGSAILKLTRVLFDREGRGVEHLIALYRPDRFSLEMKINRTGKDESREWTPVVIETDGEISI